MQEKNGNAELRLKKYRIVIKTQGYAKITHTCSYLYNLIPKKKCLRQIKKPEKQNDWRERKVLSVSRSFSFGNKSDQQTYHDTKLEEIQDDDTETSQTMD